MGMIVLSTKDALKKILGSIQYFGGTLTADKGFYFLCNPENHKNSGVTFTGDIVEGCRLALNPKWHVLKEIVEDDNEEVADAKLLAVLSAELGSKRY